MKIVGFGDSFITVCGDDYGYTNLIAKHFGGEFTTYAHEGSGSWDSFFHLQHYLNNNPSPDVVLCVWSSSGRLYHPEVRTLCYNSTIVNDKTPKNSPIRPIIDAAKFFYQRLHSSEKADMEHKFLYYWIDKELVTKYPNTKFVFMWGFPNTSCDFGNTAEFEYLYEFTNTVEIRPALIHLSYLDEWPKDLSKEIRANHMTEKMHKVLADTVISVLEDYKPGIINITL